METAVNQGFGLFMAYSGLFRLILLPPGRRSNPLPVNANSTPFGPTTDLSHRERESFPVVIVRLREDILRNEPQFKAIFQKFINK
jgi:hypothetical protein